MAANFIFSLIPLTTAEDSAHVVEPKIKLEKRVRQGGTGPEWFSEACQEINAICTEIGLSGLELSRELSEFDNNPITRESLQSYKQGYVLGQDGYMILLARLRSLLVVRRRKYGRLMRASAVEIIDDWMLLLGIDMNDPKRSPWKAFSERVGSVRRNNRFIKIDHSTIYRWYRSNKKPASMNDLIWYDEVVNAASRQSS